MQACDGAGAHLVQMSTDYVFDGTLDRPYREDDAPNPLSVYGKSKLAGELAAGDAATIVRTSWLCGAAGGNMVKTVLRLLAPASPLAFVTDQRGCPTFTADLAGPVRELAVQRRAGVFHVTNQRAVSWYEFVREIVEAAGGDRRRGATDHRRRARSAAARPASGQQRARQRRPGGGGHAAAARPPRAVARARRRAHALTGSIPSNSRTAASPSISTSSRRT